MICGTESAASVLHKLRDKLWEQGCAGLLTAFCGWWGGAGVVSAGGDQLPGKGRTSFSLAMRNKLQFCDSLPLSGEQCCSGLEFSSRMPFECCLFAFRTCSSGFFQGGGRFRWVFFHLLFMLRSPQSESIWQCFPFHSSGSVCHGKIFNGKLFDAKKSKLLHSFGLCS